MMNKSHFSLAAYLTIAAECMTQSVQAGIVYTDIDPDSAIAGNNNATEEYILIDMDNNGTPDFRIGMFNAQMSSSRTYSWNGIWASGTNNTYSASLPNAIAYTSMQSGYTLANALSTSMLVANSLNFYAYPVLGVMSYWSSSSSSGGIGSIGNFASQGDKYLGVRFIVAGNLHYGWIRVNVNPSNYGITVMDYAYESCPDQPIITGLTVGGSGTTIWSMDVCDSISYNGITYTTTQTIFDTISTGVCDSVDIVTFEIYNSVTVQQSFAGCDSVIYDGNVYTSSTMISDTTVSGGTGCPVYTHTTIDVSPSYTVNQNSEILLGDSVLLGGQFQTQAGTYIDSLTTSMGCDSIILTVLSIIEETGQSDALNGLTLRVAPNPASTYALFELSPTTEPVRVHIYDMKGNTMHSNDVINGQQMFSIDVTAWPRGIYYVVIHQGIERRTTKLVLN